MSVSAFVGPQCPYPVPFSQGALLCTQKESERNLLKVLFVLIHNPLNFILVLVYFSIGLRNVWFGLYEKLFYKHHGKTDGKSLNFREQIL